MERVARFVSTVVRDELGQDLAEYGLLAALLSVVAIAALLLVGNPVRALWAAAVAALGLIPG